MTIQPSPPPSPPIGVIALVVLACPLYALMLAAILSMPGGDPGSYGGEGSLAATLSQLYALVSGVLLWIVVGILLWIGWKSRAMPRGARIGAGILYPLSGLAAFVAADLAYSYPGGWLIVVPAALPPFLALFGMWANLPAMQAVLRPDTAGGALLGAIGVLSVATLPLWYLDDLHFPAHLVRQQAEGDALVAQRDADFAKRDREKEAWFQRLTPDSSLWDYFDPDRVPDGRREQAVEGARRVKTRQGDAERLLKEANIYWLNELWRLDLEATPDLCEAFGAALLKTATGQPDYNFNVAEDLERQLPNMKWLVTHHCNLDDGLAVAETRVRRVVAVNRGDSRWDQFLAAIIELRRQH